MTFHTPRKSLGQHFLHQRNVIDAIVSAFRPQRSDTVVEIGPGLGALTFELLPRIGQLHVIELDDHLAGLLEAKTKTYPNLHVHRADALKVDFASFTGGKKIRLIGNLPYNISTPLLFHVINQRSCIEDMCFMLQKEVGQRLLADPGSKQFGRLTVMARQSCAIEKVIYVDKGAFSPEPKVDSAVLRFAPYVDPPHPVENAEAFDQIVRAAFSQRRKTLRNALRALLHEEQICDAGVDPDARAEQLDVDAFVRLSAACIPRREPGPCRQ